MSRRSTLPREWMRLADAVGSVERLHREIGISHMHLWRIAHGARQPRDAVRNMIGIVAKKYRVPNPLGNNSTTRQAVDIEALRLFGEGLEKGIKAPRTAAFLRERYSTEQLIELAERDDVSSEVHRAVSYLLGGP